MTRLPEKGKAAHQAPPKIAKVNAYSGNTVLLSEKRSSNLS